MPVIRRGVGCYSIPFLPPFSLTPGPSLPLVHGSGSELPGKVEVVVMPCFSVFFSFSAVACRPAVVVFLELFCFAFFPA